MQRWQYHTERSVYPLPDYHLNQLGQEGWELVAVTADREQLEGGGESTSYLYLFKRPAP